jgi:transcriptional pleiotropic regulator of transition state genes
MMKSVGVVRKLDRLGRIVLPKSLRKEFNIEVNDPIEILVDKEMIVLQKYEPNMTCMLTGKTSKDNLVIGEGKIVLSPEAVEALVQKMKAYIETVKE